MASLISTIRINHQILDSFSYFVSDDHLITKKNKETFVKIDCILSGHTKQKFGVNREPSPVTFMKEWVDFISCNGDDEFKK